MLEIAIALGNEPELLILDEPTAGMSPEETAATMGLVNRLAREQGLTILFCEHDMDVVFNVATSIMVMQQGRTIIQGPPGGGAAQRHGAGSVPRRGLKHARRQRHSHLLRAEPHPLRRVAEDPQGQVVCLLGRNGAGKTTTLQEHHGAGAAGAGHGSA